ncbi:cell wall-binding protein [Berryella wangjianweii]|uniref:Cell wall-binding protein n=2 Tax=Berryella wangjianweii TaxID=2734634 RepID=A0A6M8J0L8_9ACTN|nr:cell wall-binding protein [Berryella wangjianweii]
MKRSGRILKRVIAFGLSGVLVSSMLPIGGIASTLPTEGAAGKPAAAEASSASNAEASGSSADNAAGKADRTADAVAKPAENTAARNAAMEAAAEPAASTEGKPAMASQALAELWVDGTNGDDSHDGSAGAMLKTLAKALELQAADASIGVIHVKGNLALSATASIPSGVTLFIEAEGAVISGSGNSINGIVLKSGSTLKGAGTLTMTGFKTALTSEKGSTITDGTYVLKNNAAGSGTRGLHLGGTVKGTSGKDKLVITADDKSNTNFYTSSATFENCTLNVNSQARTWFDAYDLNLKNASLTVKGFGQTFYVSKLNMEDSDLTINPSYGATGMTIQSSSNIVNSHIKANAGSTAGISIGAANGTIHVTNSTLEFANGGTGGLNVNTGKVVLANSTIKGDGRNSSALFGAQTNGSIEFKKDCLVETPAARNSDNGGGQTSKNFIVTGGSHRIKYAPSYNSSMGSTIPVNGAENGDEKLSLFTLSDPSVTLLKPLNAKGSTYDYSVAKPSSDGEKHVWVPAATAIFKLNADDAATKVDASHADGSAADKTASAMRGYALEAAKSVEGGSAAMPDDPFAPGYTFLGWFYKDAPDTEKAFDAHTVLAADTTVYAKWKSDASSYAIKYHNDADTDVTYLASSNNPSRTMQVLSIDDVTKASPAFARSGKVFKGWTTEPGGAGSAVAAGDMLSIPAGTAVVNLYATWEDKLASVKFSANGGTFSADSVFKKNPNVFDIVADANGGEIAVVKKQAKVSDDMTLSDLLKSLSAGAVTASTKGIADPVSSDTDVAYTGIATRSHYVLGNEDVKETVLFWTTHKYYYWFSDPAGSARATIDDKLKLTEDLTFYLKWSPDPSIENVEGASSIPSDMWSADQSKTTSIREVATDETFSMTGAVDAQGIVDQMNALEGSLADGLDDLAKISLSDTASTFEATIKLPDGVVVPANPKVTATGLGDCFNLEGASVKGQEVTVRFSLKDGFQNYRQLKDAVLSTGKGDAQTGAAENQHASDIAKPITVTVEGLTLDADAVTNGQELTATGAVSGEFSSYAENTVSGKVKRFNYTWTGEQIASSADPRGNDIRQTLLVVKPMDQEIPADIEVGSETEHDSVYDVTPGETLDFTGTIDASVVKSQMKGIEALFPNTTDYSAIALEDMTCSFTASFKVPNKMTLPEGLSKESVRLKGFSDTFSVSDLSVSGDTVTITMKLKAGLGTYKDLQTAVMDNLGDIMKVTVPGIKINDDLAAGETATVSGTVSGSFKARAVKKDSGTAKVFAFNWTGRQTDEGRDFTLPHDPGINFTVAAVTPVESKLPADMLVGANTEHDAVIESAQGSTFALTGAVSAAFIQDQMSRIEAVYPGADHDGIKLGVGGFSFKATFTVPDGMTLPGDLDASKVKAVDFGNGFTVSSVSVSGKTVTVTFALSDPAKIKTYSDLRRIVDAAGGADGWMKLVVPGISIDKNAAPGSLLTIKGEVSGSFRASATSAAGTHRAFSFTWAGVQWPDGKDFIATDDESIQLTMKVVAPTPAKASIEVEKVLTGREWRADDSFRFKIAPLGEAPATPLSTASIEAASGNHRASFGEATFTKPGVYAYEVTETPGNLADVTYDGSTHKVVVTVSDGANGTLVASAAYPDGMDGAVRFTNTYTAKPADDKPVAPIDGGKKAPDVATKVAASKNAPPRTGDGLGVLGGLAIAVALSGAAACRLSIRKRKSSLH